MKRRAFFGAMASGLAVPVVAVAKSVGAIPSPKFEPIVYHEPVSTETFNKRFRALHERLDNL